MVYRVEGQRWRTETAFCLGILLKGRNKNEVEKRHHSYSGRHWQKQAPLRANNFLILNHIDLIFQKNFFRILLIYKNQIALEMHWVIFSEEMQLWLILKKEDKEYSKPSHFQAFSRIFWHVYNWFNRFRLLFRPHSQKIMRKQGHGIKKVIWHAFYWVYSYL